MLHRSTWKNVEYSGDLFECTLRNSSEFADAIEVIENWGFGRALIIADELGIESGAKRKWRAQISAAGD